MHHLGQDANVGDTALKAVSHHVVVDAPTEILGTGTIYKEVKGYLEKTKSGKVYIHDDKQPGDLDIATKYKILKTFKGVGPDGESVSDLELELVTGRTHQIRAQFAHLGHPVIGDGNYGRNKVNLHFETKDGRKVRYQQLFSCQIIFGRIPKNNMHVDVSGKTFKILPDYNIKLANNA